MTEAQAIAKAWRMIAVAYYTPINNRTKKQDEVAWDGICNGVKTLLCGKPHPYIYRNMMSSLRLDLMDNDGGAYFYYPVKAEGNDEARADYCWLQAVISETGGI